MSFNHVMVDIETFATEPGAAIVSVGACVFDPIAGRYPRDGDDCPEVQDATFYQRVDLTKGPLPHVGNIDPATVKWWMSQGDAARAALYGGDSVPTDMALQLFQQWLFRNFSVKDLTEYTTPVRFWSNGPTFDEMILRDAYRRCGYSFPVHFKASRCCRTLIDLMKEGHFDRKSIPRCELKHDALADAIYQAAGVCAGYKFLGLNEGGALKVANLPENKVQ